MKKTSILWCLTALLLTSCQGETGGTAPNPTNSTEETGSSSGLVEELGLTAQVKTATETTLEHNAGYYSILDFEDKTEYEFATRGLIAAPDTLTITDENGKVVWNQTAYDFLHEEVTDTANPSLWENSKNNSIYGLFQVTEGIYQVRGYDMANLTVIESDNGYIIYDVLMSVECSQAAMELVYENLGEKPIIAVIISHPHVDHFAGIRGVIDEADVADGSLSLEDQLASGKIPIIVPEHFTEHAISENVYAGKAMSRRATYQYGSYLDRSDDGRLAFGIGMGISNGTYSFITPTHEIKETGTVLHIDGIDMEFQMTPGAEAPAEMNTWFPEKNALWLAENCTCTLHNLYTLRGAEIRDGSLFASYINEASILYGDDVEVVFQSHNWPHWGNEEIADYMSDTSAIYQFITDQTLTYINQGYTSNEISNMITLPTGLAENWYTRQYYGTVAHNSKAVYQKYMGWYDANPVNLHPLTPEESATKWIEYAPFTTVDDMLRQAKLDFDQGEFQWVAEVCNTIVFTDPENQAARYLCADALEQLGYQAESGAWRNAYLSGALELREGNQSANSVSTTSPDMLMNMTTSMVLDYMGILLDKAALGEDDFSINLQITDTGEEWLLRVKHGALLKYENYQSETADLTIATPHQSLFFLLTQNSESFQDLAELTGDVTCLEKLIDNLDEFTLSGSSSFHIIEP